MDWFFFYMFVLNHELETSLDIGTAGLVEFAGGCLFKLLLFVLNHELETSLDIGTAGLVEFAGGCLFKLLLFAVVSQLSAIPLTFF